MQLAYRLLPCAIAGLLAFPTANAMAYDVDLLGASLILETGNPATALVEVNPDAPVTEVVVWSPDCNFGPARDLGNGAWLAEADRFACYEATASITLGEQREDPMCGPFIGLKKVTMSGSSYSDSYDAAASDYSPETASNHGHVCSNGEISMSGSSTVFGDALAGPGERVKTSGSAGVTGHVGELDEPLSLPAIDPGSAPFDNQNATIARSVFGKVPLNDKGEFKLSGGDHVDLMPGTYFFSKFSLSGGSTVAIHGPTTIYTTGDFSASGGSISNDRMVPSDLRVFAMGKKVTISGESESYGLVYAPSAKVERSGSSDYFGSLVGKELVLSGSGGIHYGGGFVRDELVTITLHAMLEDG